jgi:hypothetical protein
LRTVSLSLSLHVGPPLACAHAHPPPPFKHTPHPLAEETRPASHKCRDTEVEVDDADFKGRKQGPPPAAKQAKKAMPRYAHVRMRARKRVCTLLMRTSGDRIHSLHPFFY